MHQSIKEHIVLRAQVELLQTGFQESLASSPLHASDELIMQAECKSVALIRSKKVKGINLW